MSPAQHRRYLRYWGEAFGAHWCGVRDGQPLARPGRPPSDVRDQVVGIAGQLARGGSLRADHLRHACHVIAIGRDKSSLKLTNKEQDLVIALFQRLAETGRELAGQIRLDARERELERTIGGAAEYSQASGPKSPPWTVRRPDADRKRVLWSLEHSGYAEPAIAAISRDKFGTLAWRGLSDADLYQLLLTVKRAAHRKQTPQQQPSTPAAAPRQYNLLPIH